MRAQSERYNEILTEWLQKNDYGMKSATAAGVAQAMKTEKIENNDGQVHPSPLERAKIEKQESSSKYAESTPSEKNPREPLSPQTP